MSAMGLIGAGTPLSFYQHAERAFPATLAPDDTSAEEIEQLKITGSLHEIGGKWVQMGWALGSLLEMSKVSKRVCGLLLEEHVPRLSSD